MPKTDDVAAQAVAKAWEELHLGQMLPSAGSVMVHRRMIKEIMAVTAKAVVEILDPPSSYKRPQDTTAHHHRCPGSQNPPLRDSIERWGRSRPSLGFHATSGLCSVCGRRIRLYSTGKICVHKQGV